MVKDGGYKPVGIGHSSRTAPLDPTLLGDQRLLMSSSAMSSFVIPELTAISARSALVSNPRTIYKSAKEMAHC